MSIEFTTTIKQKPIKYFVNGEIEINFSNLINILEGLEGTDGFMNSVIIYDNEVEKFLKDMEIISSNIRGGCFIKNHAKYQELLDALYNS